MLSAPAKMAAESTDSDGSHKFYIGLTEILYVEESRTYQISIKLFTDDLELALESAGIEFDPDRRAASDQAAFFDYIRDHFRLIAIGKPVYLDAIGSELENDISWIYLESLAIDIPESLKIENNLLMDVFDEQAHVINLTQGGEIRSSLFRGDKYSEEFKK